MYIYLLQVPDLVNGNGPSSKLNAMIENSSCTFAICLPIGNRLSK